MANAKEQQSSSAAAAAAEAARVIAVAAAEAARVVASSATEALQASNKQRSEDHDLLVRLDTKVEGLIQDVKKLSDRDEWYVLKEDFVFWRNLLVGGLLLTLAAGVISNFLK